MTERTMSDRRQQTAEFVRNLARLDDGERARLKRNAGKSLADSHGVTLLFYQKLLPRDAARWDEERYFLVATLYPFDKRRRRLDRRTGDAGSVATARAQTPRTLGDAFRGIRNKENETGLNRRFARLLDANEDQLPFQLRQAIIRLTGDPKEPVIDWQRLTGDILAWGHPDRYVQKSWARDYVATPRQEQEPQTV